MTEGLLGTGEGIERIEPGSNEEVLELGIGDPILNADEFENAGGFEILDGKEIDASFEDEESDNSVAVESGSKEEDGSVNIKPSEDDTEFFKWGLTSEEMNAPYQENDKYPEPSYKDE